MKRVKVYWKRITPKQTAVLHKINKTKLATRSTVIALSPQEKLSFDKLNRMMIKKPDLILGDESSFDNSIVEEMNQQPTEKSSPISREKENSGTISVRKDLIECTPEIISETPEIISETPEIISAVLKYGRRCPEDWRLFGVGTPGAAQNIFSFC
uniref:Uncharacterized protein n=1 Tax=Cacopsylla melanoneura TaxID=428564 RepID=A0A8D8Y3T4_9HEMI